MTQDEIKKALEICADISIPCNDCPYDAVGKCNDTLCADTLKLIIEQEKEIERLRTTLGQCSTELNSALESLKSQCREIGELRAKVKQAKIDVLNELKKYLHTEDFDTPDERWKPESEFCAIINELIKEVQNGEDKG